MIGYMRKGFGFAWVGFVFSWKNKQTYKQTKAQLSNVDKLFPKLVFASCVGSFVSRA